MNTCQIRKCQNPACGLRYPRISTQIQGETCPLCRAETVILSETPLEHEPVKTGQAESRAPAPGVLLDNLRSAWNVGAIFRTADGLGITPIHLCGITPTPENASVKKTALGAEAHIPWHYHRDALTAAQTLLAEGWTLWALEQHPRAEALTPNLPRPEKLMLILGNEISGVDPALLDLCEKIIHIPMRGQKRSLNVEVAFAIAAWGL
jgi:23S rRNA (guanosine2251-2'-O)-methyltransferase